MIKAYEYADHNKKISIAPNSLQLIKCGTLRSSVKSRESLVGAEAINNVKLPQKKDSLCVPTLKKNQFYSTHTGFDSVLDGSIHVGVKKMGKNHSLANLDSASSNDCAVEVNDHQLHQETIMLRKAAEDLAWKLDQEKKLNAEIVELLEKKASDYLVKINTLEESEGELKTKFDESDGQIKQL